MPRKTFNVLLVANEESFRLYFRRIMPEYLNNFSSRLLSVFGINDDVLFNIEELDLRLMHEGLGSQLEGNIDLIIFDLMPGSIPDILLACERLPEPLRRKVIGFGDRELLDSFEESRNCWQLPIFSTSTQIHPRQNSLVLAKILYGEHIELKEV